MLKSSQMNKFYKFDLPEWTGAFGDLGTFLPFVVGYISVVNFDPLGILLTFGVFLIIAGLYYKTPIPVQPMKAIGGAAVTQTGLITSNMVLGAGLFSGLFWLVLGASGFFKFISHLISKPVIRGISLGLGFSFIIKATDFMREGLAVSFVALIMTFALLRNKRIPAMFFLLVFGIIVTIVSAPALLQEIAEIRPGFKVPQFALGTLTGQEMLTGILVLALPQIPLTFGNAIIATSAENNRMFPCRQVSEKKLAIFQGIMNIISPVMGGIPMCHGAGGIAAHTKFGARSGGATIIFGAVLLILGLFFSDSVLLIFGLIPYPVLGVILFFAGLELAVSAHDAAKDLKDFYILIITAGFSVWNVGIGFLAGVIAQEVLKRVATR